MRLFIGITAWQRIYSITHASLSLFPHCPFIFVWKSIHSQMRVFLLEIDHRLNNMQTWVNATRHISYGMFSHPLSIAMLMVYHSDCSKVPSTPFRVHSASSVMTYVVDSIKAGVRFTNGCLPAIQIRWKLRLAITPLLAIRSQQTFVHATTAQLLCHVQNFVATTVLESRWEWNEISSNLNCVENFLVKRVPGLLFNCTNDQAIIITQRKHTLLID